MITKFMKTAVALGVALTLGNTVAYSDGEGKVTGKIYTDWYYNVTDDSTLGKLKPKSEAEITRGYLGYNYKVDDNFSAHVMLDVGRVNPVTSVSVSGAKDTTGHLTSVSATSKTDMRYEAFLKTAYLDWKGIAPATTLSLGLVPYIAFNVQEGWWGNRYIYPTFMDQNGFTSSADLGALVNVAPSDMFQATLGVTNGEGYKAPQDKNGLYRTALGIKVAPVKDFAIYAYGDYMPQDAGLDSAALTTVALFAGYKMEDMFRVGIEYNAQMNQGGTDTCDVSGLSLYGAYTVMKPLEVFARYDMLSSTNDWNKAKDGNTVIAGVQYTPVSKVKVALDYQMFTYKNTSAYPKGSNKVYLNCEFDY